MIVLCIILNLASFVRAQELPCIDAVCVRVVDGDTLDVVSHEKKELFRVRMWGIDAPESGQEYGAESSRLLASKALGKLVRVQVRSTDIYGRLIGEVYSGNEYINVSLLESGCAWYYERYAPRDIQLSEAQRKAQKCKNGIWATDSPLAPWLYRKINRTRLSNYAISPLIAAAASGHTEIVEYLIRAGADANGLAGKLALFAAIREDHEEVVSILLASGVDVYTKNDAYSQKCVSAIQSTGEFKGKCIRVIDGDSIDVCIDTGEIRRVHLHGIDAPELSQKHGLAAQGFLLQNVRDEQLVVSPVGKDSNGGIIANVYKEDEHVNREMVTSGWAWSEEDPHVEKSVLASESKKARMAKKGIWNDEDQPVISPWQYRQSEKIVSDTGKIAISLAASSGKFKIAKQLLAHGVSVDDEVGSVALKYAQDAKSAELSRLLVEKGAQVMPGLSSVNKEARELASSEIRKPSENDYRKSFSLVRNNFNEFNNPGKLGGLDIEEPGITSTRNQFAREGRSEVHARVDAEEAKLIKAAAEGDFETVKALVESGVDANATYSRYRIRAKKMKDAFSKGNESQDAQPSLQPHAIPTDNCAIADIGRDKLTSGLKSTLNLYPSEDSERTTKSFDYSTVSSQQNHSPASSNHYKTHSRKKLPISYNDTRETKEVAYTESHSPKRNQYSGHQSSSVFRSGRTNHDNEIIYYVFIGVVVFLFAFIVCAFMDWYEIAIRNHSLILTKLFYSLGVKLNGRSLHLAALCGDVEITRFIISKGMKIEHGAYGSLEIALREKHYEVAKILLMHGADAHVALSKAIEQGNQECMYFLCFTAPEILSEYDYVQKLMSKAIKTNNYNSVACLLKFGVTVDSSHLSQAIEKGCGGMIIREIINNGVRPTVDNINNSIAFASMESFMALLDYGINLNGPIETNPLCQAVRYCRPLMVKLLLERGADLNKIKATDKAIIDNLLEKWRLVDHKRFAECLILLMGIGMNDQRCGHLIERLLELRNGSDVLLVIMPYVRNKDFTNAKGESLLAYSLKNKNLRGFDILVDAGANIEMKNENYQSILMQACYNSLPDNIITHVIEKGADVNACDNTGMTPFIYACLHLSYSVVKTAIYHNANVNSYDMYMNTALIYACRRYRITGADWLMDDSWYHVVVALVEQGSNVNAANCLGKTPLHIAVEEQNEKLVKLLLEKGASTNVVDKKGKTPVLIAGEKGNRKILLLLIENGAGTYDLLSAKPHLLLSSIMCRDSRLAKLLIKNGANVNDADSNGTTCLEHAIVRRMSEVSLLLIDHGANVLARRRGSTTLLYKAQKNGLEVVARKIREKGGRMYAYQQESSPLIHKQEVFS